ncbi:MAG: methyltransferase domain-containing protein [Candidatus Aegiribacteria sp.]|nr:methyltransferase domain-containing protein [Candidatus Aegiribacteria sp.]MBD3294920.1 methyltransferase domain-containing protein [Candidatus Fermentibacteria bacterium]
MEQKHVCPVWMGYILSSPLRKLIEKPSKRLSPHLEEGMTVIDAGCAMGFYSIPMARMVGPSGRVVCVDLQEKMVRKLFKKAKKKDLHDRIEARVCTSADLNLGDLKGVADFVLAASVVHEVPDAGRFFSQLFSTMREGAKLMVLEPSGHVSRKSFEDTMAAAVEKGYRLLDDTVSGRRLFALFQRDSGPDEDD